MYTDVKLLSLLLWGRFPCFGLFFLYHDNISAISYFFMRKLCGTAYACPAWGTSTRRRYATPEAFMSASYWTS